MAVLPMGVFPFGREILCVLISTRFKACTIRSKVLLPFAQVRYVRTGTVCRLETAE
jgi:hypothetical protein